MRTNLDGLIGEKSGFQSKPHALRLKACNRLISSVTLYECGLWLIASTTSSMLYPFITRS
jgi:hypothetical protein